MPLDYSLADLARLADVTPRTIRYYVAQGLLPSPDAAGPATRYSEGHLARLRLIRRLQRDHLPLAEIRERLEMMSDDEVVAALVATGSTPAAPAMAVDAADTVGYIRSLMEQAHIEPNVHPAVHRSAQPVRPDLASPRLALGRSISLSEEDLLPAAEPPAAHEDRAGSTAMLRRSVEAYRSPDERLPSRSVRSTWERWTITPDIEIHVRRPLKPHDNKRAEALERYAREIFQDAP